MRKALSSLALFALAAAPAFAQDAGAPPTTITPDTLPSLATDTTTITDGAVTTIGGGVRAGDNLFHSFARFNLGPGDVARWTASDALTIRNVINRVTGGERSFIAGFIDATEMPGADFYFVNPAGIVFGDGAAIDVGGTAHFSTAHTVGFADGTVLVSGTASGSSFSMADPVRFGFLGGNKPIVIQSAPLEVELFTFGTADRLALSASDILITNANAALGTASWRAVGQRRGTFALADRIDQGLRGGRVELVGAQVAVFGGEMTLAADQLRISKGGAIAVFADEAALPAFDVLADVVDIAEGQLILSGLVDSVLRSGDMRIRANQILLRDRALVRIESRITGGGGTVFLDADLIDIDGGLVVASGFSAPGRSVGEIVVRAGTLRLSDRGVISSTLFNPVQLGDGSLQDIPTGTTGNIVIDAGRIELLDGLILASSTSRTASGPGSITIRADEMVIGTGEISTRTDSAIAAGSIDITVKGLFEMTGFGGVNSTSAGLGNAGAITIRAGSLRMIDDLGGPTISSGTEIPRAQEFTRLSDYTGSAGQILIEADSIEMIGRSTITTSSSSLGNAGDIVIRAGRMTLSGLAQITSAAELLEVPPSAEELAANSDLELVLREIPGPGRAGKIQIFVSNTLTMDGGTISTATRGFGAAGEVNIGADRIVMGAGSRISSDAGSLAPGKAGEVILVGNRIALSDGAEVTTSSANELTAGRIGVFAQDEIVITGKGSRIASINSATGKGGDAGSIALGAPRITLGPGAAIITNSAQGAAGGIALALPDTGILRLAGGAMPATIATSSGPGTGGLIFIASPYAVISDGGRIEALGQQGGAQALVEAGFFIRSADNSNLLLVDGDLVVDSQVGNVSSGIDTPDISFGDAAGVLAGQCRAARNSGSVSRLSIDQVGPLALDALDVGPPGGCR